MSDKLKGCHIFSIGQHGTFTATRDTLDAMVENFRALKRWPAIQPVLCLGHDKQRFAQARRC